MNLAIIRVRSAPNRAACRIRPTHRPPIGFLYIHVDEERVACSFLPRSTRWTSRAALTPSDSPSNSNKLLPHFVCPRRPMQSTTRTSRFQRIRAYSLASILFSWRRLCPTLNLFPNHRLRKPGISCRPGRRRIRSALQLAVPRLASSFVSVSTTTKAPSKNHGPVPSLDTAAIRPRHIEFCVHGQACGDVR
ncbi:hypothetical protein BJ912DRAFT_101280 [Pholiota molesta]|nr:hypothetical protein BJ912DRAFT_101280 [Pholiota molesta]